MKITVDVDCTADEARQFFGLPDVKALQETLMAAVEAKMKASMETMDPDALFKAWLPTGVQGMEQMQKAFWTQMMGGKKDGTP